MNIFVLVLEGFRTRRRHLCLSTEVPQHRGVELGEILNAYLELLCEGSSNKQGVR